MRLKYWLLLGLAGAVACGSIETSVSSDPSTSGRRDGGVRRDGGSTDDDDSEDDDAEDDDESTTPTTRRDASTPRRDGAVEACEKFSVPARANAPDILIVLDRSGSMISGGRWQPSVNAIKKFTSALDGAVSFGLMLYPDPTALFGQAASCAPGKLDVPFATNNAMKIASTLDWSGPGATSQTPTAASLEAARAVVETPTCADCPTKEKYVVLVTDGQPNCGASGDRMGADVANTVAAIKAMTAVGVKTYVVGYDTKTDPQLGQVMDQFAAAGGTDEHFGVENEATFVAELTKIAGQVISCEYELNEPVSDPTYVRVAIDTKSYGYQQDWTLEDGKRVILQGAACATLRDAKTHNLEITVECTPVQVL